MQVLIRHSLPEKLVLPIGYHHILQAIIYQSLNPSFGYSGYIHETGIGRGVPEQVFYVQPASGKV